MVKIIILEYSNIMIFDAAMRKNSANVVEVLKNLANENRLNILCFIAENQKNVSEIITAIGGSQSNLSQHLAILRHQKIIASHREKNHVYYTINDKQVLKLIIALKNIYCRK